MGWICGGLAVIGVLAFIWMFLRGNVYKHLFADEHFIEVARGLGRITTAAFESQSSEDTEVRSPQQDPRMLITSAGMIVVYTESQVDDRFVHHYSVSVGGGYTAHAVGETFVLLTAKLLGIAYDRLTLGIGASTVHHAEFELSDDENKSLRERVIPEFSATDVAEFRKEWMAVRDQLHWGRESNAA